MASELEFLTRPDCGLCDDALATLLPISRLARVSVTVTDLTYSADQGLLERIPVVRLPNGRELHTGPMTRLQALASVIRARLARSQNRDSHP